MTLYATPWLHLMHLVSPALPIGAYAYSQGIEWAIEAGWLQDGPGIPANTRLAAWLEGLLEHGLGRLDLPVLVRCLDALAHNDMTAFNDWNDYIRAARETRELLLEDEQMGMALARLLRDLDVPQASSSALLAPPAYVSQFALACHHWHVAQPEALIGFAWSWLENQVAAATKLVPLGQTQAQRLLLRIMPRIEAVCVQAARWQDSDLGSSLPGLALASASHERQYTRLFRS